LRGTIERRFDPKRARRVSVAAAVVGLTVLSGAGVIAAAFPISDNAEMTKQLDAAYEPFEETELEDSVVFVPTPHGNWLSHPMQWLQNDPDYEEGPVYALHMRQFAVVDAFPDRSYYRYTYRGAWAPTAGEPVEPHLQRVTVTEGESVAHRFRLGVPAYAEQATVRLASDDGQTYASLPFEGDRSLETVVNVTEQEATLSVDSATETGPRDNVTIDDRDTLELQAFVDYGTGVGITYRADLPVESRGGTVRTLTPYLEVCEDAFTCDGEAAHIPGTHRDFVAIDHEATSRP
jgi:hypothetical protein